MSKKLISLVIVLTLLLSLTSVAAEASEPVIFRETITVNEDGGNYQVGFINVEFKKNFLEPESLPVTLEVQVYADNGIGYIEFTPGTSEFLKKVHIRVGAYNGQLYDVSQEENIEVNFKNQQILAEHFSRYSYSD